MGHFSISMVNMLKYWIAQGIDNTDASRSPQHSERDYLLKGSIVLEFIPDNFPAMPSVYTIIVDIEIAYSYTEVILRIPIM